MTDDTSGEKGLEVGATTKYTMDSTSGGCEGVYSVHMCTFFFLVRVCAEAEVGDKDKASSIRLIRVCMLCIDVCLHISSLLD